MSVITFAQNASLGQWALFALLLSLLLVYASFFRERGNLHGAPPLDREGIPGIGPLRFWTDRVKYLHDAGQRSKTGNFSFYVGPWPIIGLSGPSGRAAYYNTGFGMELTEAMNALVLGEKGIPHDPHDKNVQAKKGWNGFLRARVLESVRPARLKLALPKFFDDCVEAYTKLGDSGSIDPMTDIYFLAWQMSMQAMGPAEIYESPSLLKKTFGLSLDLDATASALNVFFPWVPTPAKVKKTISGIRLFMILSKVIKNRKKQTDNNKAPQYEDGLQLMLNHGDSASNVIKHTIEALFAAQLNTAQNAAATLCYLGSYPIWQKRLREELVSVAAQYSTDINAPLATQLQSIPTEVWDSGMPIMYACLKDSIRMQTNGGFCRINLTGQPVPLHPLDKDGQRSGPEVIPPQAIIIYSSTDTKANGDVYPDPDTWNPGRYLPKHEDYAKQRYREGPYTDTTWGSGNHMCTGMKLAKLEVHVIVAMFVAMFDWDLTDDKGERLDKGVRPSWDVYVTCRPKEPYRLRYTKRISESRN